MWRPGRLGMLWMQYFYHVLRQFTPGLGRWPVLFVYVCFFQQGLMCFIYSVLGVLEQVWKRFLNENANCEQVEIISFWKLKTHKKTLYLLYISNFWKMELVAVRPSNMHYEIEKGLKCFIYSEFGASEATRVPFFDKKNRGWADQKGNCRWLQNVKKQYI